MDFCSTFKPHKNCLDPFVCKSWGYCLYGCDELGDYGKDRGCVLEIHSIY